ncbi:hypothetical protein E2F43_18925 [Seongchinamella unica]|uniref:Uncharacterized protein n=1 Tax=Seongchinamella unica TaxID=2547392 RepID=A0A4R5LMS0_9GAMM|nr:hypothetical protein [Seongchinamella unica]TDG11270.1 hypothetical protein E2F43_18925 [Seongchinamella unica]
MNTGNRVSTFLAALAFCSQLHAQSSLKETIDVVGQGMAGPVVSENGATLIRTKNGITASLTMPTPVSGSYNYPAGNAFQPLVFAGHPEAFTGWMFVFNNPEGCTDPCNGDDLGDTPARGGAFNFAGHAVGGSTLNLTGHVSKMSEPFAGASIDNPFGAEVHLAVAPHGGLQPDLLPTQITFPIGTSAEWWLAIFLP